MEKECRNTREQFKHCGRYRKRFALSEEYAGIYDLFADGTLLAPRSLRGLRDYSISFFGVPVLYSVKCGKEEDGEARAFRVLFEPGGRELSVAGQIDCSLFLLARAAEYLRWDAWASECVNRAIRALFPSQASETEGWEGGIWLGLDTSDRPPMVRLYASLRHYKGLEGWQRLADLFGEFAQTEMEPVFRKVMEKAESCGGLVGVCCGFSARGLEGIRLYSDIAAPDPQLMDSLAESFFPGEHEETSRFIREFAERFGDFGAHGVTVGYDFAGDGALLRPVLARIKFELSACLFSGEEQAVLADWVGEHAFVPCESLAEEMRRARECLGELYFHYVSVGIQRGKKKHLTLYFEPFTAGGRLAYKCGRGEYRIRKSLLGLQAEDGAWRDFALFPGLSDSWVTAYVGLCLLEEERLFQRETKAALLRARRFLLKEYRPGEGWGYNGSLRCDCDSTAHALQFLRRMEERYPEETGDAAGVSPDAGLLLRFWRENGGFATYDEGREDGWNAPQPDVTAPAFQALEARRTEYRRLKTIHYLAAFKGLFPSYWWTSPFYGALKVLDAGQCSDPGRLEQALEQAAVPDGAFDLSMYLELLCKTDRWEGQWADGSDEGRRTASWRRARIHDAAARLLEKETSGQFDPEPILRVTNRRDDSPAGAGGQIYADERGIFTAATALRALCVCRAWLEGKEYEDNDALDHAVQ